MWVTRYEIINGCVRWFHMWLDKWVAPVKAGLPSLGPCARIVAIPLVTAPLIGGSVPTQQGNRYHGGSGNAGYSSGGGFRSGGGVVPLDVPNRTELLNDATIFGRYGGGAFDLGASGNRYSRIYVCSAGNVSVAAEVGTGILNPGPIGNCQDSSNAVVVGSPVGVPVVDRSTALPVVEVPEPSSWLLLLWAVCMAIITTWWKGNRRVR